jgi:hypothetical protein
MVGTGGTAGTGATGTVCNNATVLRTAGASLSIAATAGVTRSDTVGFDQKMVITATAANDVATIIFDYPSLVAGATYRPSLHLKMASTVSLLSVDAYLDVSYNSSVNHKLAMLSPNGQAGNWPDGDYDLVLIGDEITIPAGVTFGTNIFRMDFKFSAAAGNGTTQNDMRIGCVSLDRVA